MSHVLRARADRCQRFLLANEGLVWPLIGQDIGVIQWISPHSGGAKILTESKIPDVNKDFNRVNLEFSEVFFSFFLLKHIRHTTVFPP